MTNDKGQMTIPRSTLMIRGVRLLPLRSLALLPLVLLIGCTVGPNYAAPDVTVRPNYGGLVKTTSTDPATQPSRAHAQAEPVERWWTTLNDATLDTLVRRAV